LPGLRFTENESIIGQVDGKNFVRDLK